MLITIPKTLETDIMNFVKLNKIEDINLFLSICLRDGFNIAKYGRSPQDNFNKENKPFKIDENDKKELDIRETERKETKRRGRPKKQSTTEESIKQEEKREEVVKPKKKITIIKK
jgi:hypothetical protein